MSVLAWIVLGLIASFVASNIVQSSGQGMLLDIALGIVGAVVGGYLFTAIGATASRGLISTAFLSQLSARWLCFGSTTPPVAALFDRVLASKRS
jgi:uncharacterized membrane protein YeaQ/YmgE (transglycosylase-associated protein family)